MVCAIADQYAVFVTSQRVRRIVVTLLRSSIEIFGYISKYHLFGSYFIQSIDAGRIRLYYYHTTVEEHRCTIARGLRYREECL